MSLSRLRPHDDAILSAEIYALGRALSFRAEKDTRTFGTRFFINDVYVPALDLPRDAGYAELAEWQLRAGTAMNLMEPK